MALGMTSTSAVLLGLAQTLPVVIFISVLIAVAIEFARCGKSQLHAFVPLSLY
jgi:fructose-specific phosphotransferase system IIC component